VTPANVHDSRMLPALLDGENTEAMVWADSAYQSTVVDSVLKEVGYEGRIQEKGRRQHPLAAAKARIEKGPRPVPSGTRLCSDGDGHGR
ncbi:MAG: transposase, partial [Synechococcus sp. SB0678_bin_12]|nr:transposase [Synechococcus sp. SB0678_bin_12]